MLWLYHHSDISQLMDEKVTPALLHVIKRAMIKPHVCVPWALTATSRVSEVGQTPQNFGILVDFYHIACHNGSFPTPPKAFYFVLQYSRLTNNVVIVSGKVKGLNHTYTCIHSPPNSKGNKSWIFIGRTDAEAEAPILWLPDAKGQLIGKDPDAGKGWGQEEKGMTEVEMVGWHHRLNGHEFEQTLVDDEGQGSLACCSPWGHKELETTERLNNNVCAIQWVLVGYPF